MTKTHTRRPVYAPPAHRTDHGPSSGAGGLSHRPAAPRAHAARAFFGGAAPVQRQSKEDEEKSSGSAVIKSIERLAGFLANGGDSYEFGLMSSDKGHALGGKVEAGNVGENRYGFKGDGGLVGAKTKSGGLGVDVGVLNAHGEVSVGKDGASWGAAANLIEGKLEFGEPEADERHDLEVAVGGSIGVGIGGRLHCNDADGDGVRELGFGGDAGPISFDVKSETLGHVWNWLSARGDE